MPEDSGHLYEQAFEAWLIDQQVDFVHADEHRRPSCLQTTVKSFDFLLRARNGTRIIVEVKGRTYRGTNLTRLRGLDCWVTLDDVDGLHLWQEALGEEYVPVFVFAYRMAQVDVDYDGRDVFPFGSDRYLFFAVRAGDYGRYMRRRSRKWRTVTLKAEDFRRCAMDIARLIVDPTRSAS